MKKFLVLVAAVLLTNGAVNAEKRTKSQILSVASEVLQNKGLKTSVIDNQSVKLEILDSSYSQLSIVGYKNGSFVIVSNDDEMPAVFGYSDKGAKFDPNHMAPAFVWMLETANRNIEECLANGTSFPTTAISPDCKPEVPQLCTTKWSQGDPYNRQTPTYEGNYGEEHYVTGCAATAMSQAMKHYNYPEIGRGRIKYDFNPGDGNQRNSMRFDEEPFDWENMLDEYHQYQFNENQGDAVAYLMKAAGASIKMGYTPNGSGAFNTDVAYALHTYFKYDKSIECYHKDFLFEEEWFDIAYKSLSAGYPLIIGAASSIGGQDAGHSFIVDGYDTKGKVHVNFGWAGDSDGYYDFLNMHGYDHGFDMTPVKLPQEDSKITSIWGQFVDNLDYNQRTGIAKCRIINCSVRDFTGKVGVLLQNSADGSQILLGDADYADNAMIVDGNRYNVQNFSAEAKLPDNLADGEYRLFLASRGTWKVKDDPTDKHGEEYLVEEAQWQPVRSCEGYKNSYIVKVEGGNVTISSDKSYWTAGIDNAVKVNHASDIVRVYDLQGRMVYTSAQKDFRIQDVPAEGMLIIKNGTEVRKVMK